MTIRRLPEHVVNRIAAGEVIERPASAVKELVENSLDAGASRIEVTVRDGGKSLITVTDDGTGMTPEELHLAVERHATSKLPEDDLDHIRTLGFRGEALPSIGSVGRLALTSRTAEADTAWRLTVDGGDIGELAPAALSKGTRIELRDLFYATPARLKFLRADRTESSQIGDAISRLAMARPDVSFTLIDGERTKIKLEAAQGELLDARLRRLARPHRALPAGHPRQLRHPNDHRDPCRARGVHRCDRLRGRREGCGRRLATLWRPWSKPIATALWTSEIGDPAKCRVPTWFQCGHQRRCRQVRWRPGDGRAPVRCRRG